MTPDLARKLAILSDAAKYDASCASSGTERRDARKGGIGSTEGSAMCALFAATTAPQRGSSDCSASTFAPVPLKTGNASACPPKCARTTDCRCAV